MNTFAYAMGNPLSYIDPRGLTVAHAGRVGWVIGGTFTRSRWGQRATLWALDLAWDALNDDPLDDSDDEECDDEEFCRKAREDCAEFCADVYEDPFGREKVFGGSISQCIKNCLPERCGGEPKWKGYIYPPGTL